MNTWNCQAFCDRVDEWVHGVELVPDDARGHAETCQACRQRWAQAQRVAAATRALGQEALQTGPSEAVRANLQAIARKRLSADRHQEGERLGPWVWGLAAAGVLAVLAVTMTHRTPPAPGLETTAVARGPESRAVAHGPDALTRADAAAAHRTGALPQAMETTKDWSHEDEAFEPGLTVVQVPLEGDGLTAALLGAAWPDGGDEAEMTAELLVDAYGVARAVRLVPTEETVMELEESL